MIALEKVMTSGLAGLNTIGSTFLSGVVTVVELVFDVTMVSAKDVLGGVTYSAT
jgi:hypothetical protein